jgi:replicative DNA helicase
MANVPPSALDAERDVLAACLLDPTLVDVAAGLLTAEDWYADAHRVVWEALLGLAKRGMGIDHTTLRTALLDAGRHTHVGGDEWLLGLTSCIPDTGNIETHCRIVREKAARRRMIMACHEGAANGYDASTETADYLDRTQAAVFEAAREVDGRSGPQRFAALIPDVVEDIQAAKSAGGITGLPTGLRKLDLMTTGFHPGEFIVIAGRPGMGKTAVATCAAVYASVELRRPSLIFSLEMPSKQIVARALATYGKIDLKRMRSGGLVRDDAAKLIGAADALSRAPIIVDDTPAITLMQLRARARRVRAKEGDLAVVVVDYIQLMRSGMGRESREIEVGDISRGLKVLSKELECPVVALAQLNRECEKRQDKRPMLSDLRESGAIEQDADAVVFVYRDEVYDKNSPDRGIAELILSKQRNGATGTARVRFWGEWTRFDNLAEDDWDSGGNPYGDD